MVPGFGQFIGGSRHAHFDTRRQAGFENRVDDFFLQNFHCRFQGDIGRRADFQGHGAFAFDMEDFRRPRSDLDRGQGTDRQDFAGPCHHRQEIDVLGFFDLVLRAF